MTKLEHALAWARAGWQVFPCKPGVKEPATPNGVKDATRDEAQILEWWIAQPDFNIGGTFGLIADCDHKGGRSGELEFQKWLDDKGLDGLSLIGAARRHRTPGGGLHVIFDTTEALGQPDLIKGLVNLRTAGNGYVCLPGSTIDKYDGRGYTVEHDVAPTAAPAPLVLHCRQRERAELAAPAELDNPRNITRALTYLAHAAPAIQGMSGDNHTYQTAQDVLDMGVSPRTALELMIQHWNPRCVPPWPIDELVEKVRNAVSYRQNDLGATKMGASDPSASIEAMRARAAATTAAPPKLEGQGPGGGGKGRLRTAAELRDMPPVSYLVDLILPERSILMVYGAAKSGKSLLVLDLALALATGRKSWAGLELAEGPGGVVYCTGEGNLFLGSRYRAWCSHNDMSEPPPPERFQWAEIVPKLGHPLEGDALELVRSIVQMRPRPRLLILDTLEMATLDIIDAVEAVTFMGNLRELVDEIGCAVIIVHHENREGENRGSRVYKHQVDGAVRLELANGQHDPRRLLSSDVHRAGRGLGDVPRGFVISPSAGDACMSYDPTVEAAIEEQHEAARQQTIKEKAVQELWVPRIEAIIVEGGGLYSGSEGKQELLKKAAMRIASETGMDEPSIGDAKTKGHPLYEFNRVWCHPTKGDKRLLRFVVSRGSRYPEQIGAIIEKENEE